MDHVAIYLSYDNWRILVTELYLVIFYLSWHVKNKQIVRHVTGNDQDYLRKIPRVVVQKSALL